MLHAARGVRDGAGLPLVGVVARLEPEKGHPTLIEAWPLVLRACPDAYLLIVGEGSRRDALEAQARGAARGPSRRVHRPPRRRPGGDGRARRRRPALVPRGPGPDDPRGDGALPPGRRLERRRDPRDDRGRGDRPARPAARSGRARRRRSSGCCPTIRSRTCSAGPATTSSTSGSAWSGWSSAIEAIYDEGARVVRPSEVAAAG